MMIMAFQFMQNIKPLKRYFRNFKGFQRNDTAEGYEILRVKGWDYSELIATYEKQLLSREHHVPVMIHVNELTQPQGHSTSGSHERYKDADRLAWEREFDCIRQMKLWMIAINIASSEELDEMLMLRKRR
jgi:TPP-dependent pyruvate/acetoin dehydrogenase alpha subunit